MSFTLLLVDSITKAAAGVTPDMLTKVWSELDYQIDISCASRGEHIHSNNCEDWKFCM